MRVRDVMTSPAVSLPTTASVAEAAAAMVRDRIGCVVVVRADDPGRVAGLFTEARLELAEATVPMAMPATTAPRLMDLWAQSPEQLEGALAAVAGRRLAEVMEEATTADADEPLWEAMRRMAELGIRRMPVLEGGRLVGLVARHDLLKAVAALGGAGAARR
ncbi:CBS domain-containing protein [Miltoncostaea marina]|uniref:CBS domain-containing protein n=1 Tax=Miltoncostaea marina TaxID=2843215 RepID=UPI001C3CE581|nr:CBS domain-containing protein [Miltoncostaea marina]